MNKLNPAHVEKLMPPEIAFVQRNLRSRLGRGRARDFRSTSEHSSDHKTARLRRTAWFRGWSAAPPQLQSLGVTFRRALWLTKNRRRP